MVSDALRNSNVRGRVHRKLSSLEEKICKDISGRVENALDSVDVQRFKIHEVKQMVDRCPNVLNKTS